VDQAIVDDGAADLLLELQYRKVSDLHSWGMALGFDMLLASVGSRGMRRGVEVGQRVAIGEWVQEQFLCEFLLLN
jgi:hypothetical protein